MGVAKFEGTQEEWDALVQKERISKMSFKQYKRKGLSEMIAVTEFIHYGGDMAKVSLSSPDHLLQTHNPEEFEQGFVARNPKNHEDLWYVAKKYFDDNLEPAEPVPATATTETFMDRLIKERDELKDKFFKLTQFLESGKAKEVVSARQFEMLKAQQTFMDGYLLVLNDRIEDIQAQAAPTTN